MLPGQDNPMIAAGPKDPPTMTACGNASCSFQSAQSYTFAAMPIGTASGDRIVAVAIACNNFNTATRDISAVTIGGIAAQQATYIAVGTGSARFASAIWYALVPSGTTADVVVTWSASGSLSYSMTVETYCILGADQDPASANSAVQSGGGTGSVASGYVAGASVAIFAAAWTTSSVQSSYAVGGGGVTDYQSATSGSNTSVRLIGHLTSAGNVTLNVGSLFSSSSWTLATAEWQ